MFRVMFLLVFMLNISCSKSASIGHLIDGIWQCQRTTEHPGIRTVMQSRLSIDIKSSTFSEAMTMKSSYEDGSNVTLSVKGGGKVEVNYDAVVYHFTWLEINDESGRMSGSSLGDLKAGVLKDPKTVNTVRLTDTEWVVSSAKSVGEVVCTR